jgi:pyridoxamine 5'-phosphate oxidase
VNIETSRDSYTSPPLLERDLGNEPMVALRGWLDTAYGCAELREPNAMTLATADAQGRVSARIVLLRGLDGRGLQFYTSYFSRKAQQLEVNPRAAATFFWAPLHRQVRVEGSVTQLSEDESDAYFETRPRGHQLSAWASEQSAQLDRRETLVERMTHFDERFAGNEVPRPHSWGGYVLAPDYVEFWQGQANRLHDRLIFERAGAASWSLRRLQP